MTYTLSFLQLNLKETGAKEKNKKVFAILFSTNKEILKIKINDYIY